MLQSKKQLLKDAMQITSLSCKEDYYLENMFSIISLNELKKLFNFQEEMSQVLHRAVEMKLKWIGFKKLCHLIMETYRNQVKIFNVHADSIARRDKIVEALHQVLDTEIVINSSIDSNMKGFSIHIWHDGILYDSTYKIIKQTLKKKLWRNCAKDI